MPACLGMPGCGGARGDSGGGPTWGTPKRLEPYAGVGRLASCAQCMGGAKGVCFSDARATRRWMRLLSHWLLYLRSTNGQGAGCTL